MQIRVLGQRLISAALGIGLLYPTAILAVDFVQYLPSTSFALNPSTGNPNQDLGIVRVQSDNPNGWILKVRSTERGSFRHATHPSAVPYTLTVDGTQVSSLDSGDDVPALTDSRQCPPPDGCILPVRATTLASDIAGKPAGSYSDTLVFTLVNQ